MDEIKSSILPLTKWEDITMLIETKMAKAKAGIEQYK
jgi:hypothetical protein